MSHVGDMLRILLEERGGRRPVRHDEEPVHSLEVDPRQKVGKLLGKDVGPDPIDDVPTERAEFGYRPRAPSPAERVVVGEGRRASPAEHVVRARIPAPALPCA